ncbi:hypothetical protein D3C81_2204610 [compost metagenome]
MHKPAPMTFGARLAAHAFKKEEILRIFSVPDEQLGDSEPPGVPADDAKKIQIGPLDC